VRSIAALRNVRFGSQSRHRYRALECLLLGVKPTLRGLDTMSAFGGNTGFSMTDWVALILLGVSALVGTFGKRLVRIIGLAVMPFAFVGLVLSLNHYESAPGQGPITNNVPGINTNNTNNRTGGTNTLNIIGPQRLLFDATIGDQLASKLPTGKSIEIMAVGSRTDWNIADEYAQYLKAKGFAVSFSRSSEIVPPPDHKITIRDDLTTSPIVVIIAPSAL
jgi:hypothetical protein